MCTDFQLLESPNSEEYWGERAYIFFVSLKYKPAFLKLLQNRQYLKPPIEFQMFAYIK